ncbi:peptidase S8/S53 domain-containing protein [Mycena sanguinolenta]|nr:peptidase S8/S53 domain-containing protein [Mycena sanguinolenta]
MLRLRTMGDFPPAASTFASLVFPATDSDSDEPNNSKADLAKTVIQWLFVVIALILIACFFLRKVFGPRTAHHGMLHIPDSIYRQGQSSFALPTPHDPMYMCGYVAACPALAHPPPVHSVSAANPPHHRVRAVSARSTTIRGLDIGEGGRRINEDAELVLSDNDVLPAYDGRDRPPKDIITTLIAESDATRPNVLTTSYGFDESDLSRSVANTLCNAYLQLGALGTSILFSSGDGGVSGSQSQSWLYHSSLQASFGLCSTNFIPTLPSDCPYVTSVGATQGTTETAASFSAGGFSNYFGIPSYQAADVAAYLSTLGAAKYAGQFNATGRGYPDVSFQGSNFEMAWDTELGTVDGTSCSSPAFASVMALLNDQLIAAGKLPLGFLNPFLYSDAGRAALNDVASGDNPGCNTNGFPAVAGWDTVTGLGTPNFAALQAAVGL